MRREKMFNSIYILGKQVGVILWIIVHSVDVTRMRDSYWRQRTLVEDANTNTMLWNANSTNTFIRLLWSADTVTKAYRCAVLCQSDPKCVSFYYDDAMGSCLGFSIVLGNLTDPHTDTARYFIQRGADGYIGDRCIQNSDCTVENAECRGNQCQCSPGFSFYPSQRTCTAKILAACQIYRARMEKESYSSPASLRIRYVDCSVYAREYTKVQSYFLHGNNIESYSPVTLAVCAELCANVTAFLCKTFEYGVNTETCGLQTVTYLDIPDNWYRDPLYSDWSHYQRDCQ